MAEVKIKDAKMSATAPSEAYIDIEMTLIWTDRRLMGSNELPDKLWTPYLTLNNTAHKFEIETIRVCKEQGVSSTIR
jgi:hypothetical protein